MTAVNWLIDQLNKVNYNPLEKDGYSKALGKVKEQAKEMEYKQSMDAMQKGMELQEKENNRVGFRERNGLLSSQTEISDEEIRIESMARFRPVSYQECFEEGAKWYREQLKCKGSDGHELDDDIPPTTKYFPTSSPTQHNSPKVENKTSFGEVSDENIEKASEEKYPYNELRDGEFKGMLISAKKNAWVDAIRWYREQLKQRQ